jgi:hypothetical protein
VAPAKMPVTATPNKGMRFTGWTSNCAIDYPSQQSAKVTVSSGTCNVTGSFSR